MLQRGGVVTVGTGGGDGNVMKRVMRVCFHGEGHFDVAMAALCCVLSLLCGAG